LDVFESVYVWFYMGLRINSKYLCIH